MNKTNYDIFFKRYKNKQKKISKKLMIVGIFGSLIIMGFFSVYFNNFMGGISVIISYVFILLVVHVLMYQKLNNEFQIEKMKKLVLDVSYDAIFYNEKKIDDNLVLSSNILSIPKRCIIKSKNYLECQINNLEFIVCDLEVFYYVGKGKKVKSNVFIGRFFVFNKSSNILGTIRKEIKTFSELNALKKYSKRMINGISIYALEENIIFNQLSKLIIDSKMEIGISFTKDKIYMAIANEHHSSNLVDITSFENIRKIFVTEMETAKQLTEIIYKL